MKQLAALALFVVAAVVCSVVLGLIECREPIKGRS